MRLILPTVLVAVFAIVECSHTFLGTNVMRPLLERHTATYRANSLQKRVETYTYSTPPTRFPYKGYTIQGILAYDLTNSSASANVTSGGLGHSFVTLRMKSDRGKPLRYDIYIYA